jgi:hypothetical protein
MVSHVTNDRRQIFTSGEIGNPRGNYMGTGSFSIVTGRLVKSCMLRLAAVGRNTKRMHNFHNYLLNKVIICYT